MTGNTLARLAELDTGAVSDALDFLGLAGATVGLLPLWPCPKIVGRASTVQLGPRTDAAPRTHLISPVIDAIQSRDRILVVAGGIDGVSCWGDILANAAVTRGVRGTIIDGYSRDIEGSESIAYPVYGRGLTMVSARNRIVQLSAGEPLRVAGFVVNEDDYVIADRCGTVFIPAGRISEVLDLAQRIDERERGMLAAVRGGRSVAEVMHDSRFDAIGKPGEPHER